MVEGHSQNELSFPFDQCEETFLLRKVDDHEHICKAFDTSFNNIDNMRIHKRKYYYKTSEIVECVTDMFGKGCKTKDLLRRSCLGVYR